MSTQDSTKTLSQARLKELLHYDPDTGIFTWRVKPNTHIRIGAAAGGVTDGYLRIKIAGKLYRAHRLAFLYMEDTIPSKDVDHINGEKLDNRWANLRHLTHSENMHNICAPHAHNTSGYLGVSWCNRYQKWRATINVNKKQFHLGYFDDPAVASHVHLEAKDRLHPTHMRLKRAA
jgi:hypothetical protein